MIGQVDNNDLDYPQREVKSAIVFVQDSQSQQLFTSGEHPIIVDPSERLSIGYDLRPTKDNNDLLSPKKIERKKAIPQGNEQPVDDDEQDCYCQLI